MYIMLLTNMVLAPGLGCRLAWAKLPGGDASLLPMFWEGCIPSDGGGASRAARPGHGLGGGGGRRWCKSLCGRLALHWSGTIASLLLVDLRRNSDTRSQWNPPFKQLTNYNKIISFYEHSLHTKSKTNHHSPPYHYHGCKILHKWRL